MWHIFCKHEFKLYIERCKYPDMDRAFYYRKKVKCVKCSKEYYMEGEETRMPKGAKE